MAINDVLRNFDKEISQIKDASEKAIYECGADLQRESLEQTPFKTGKLRLSSELKMEKTGQSIFAQVSFNTPYAAKMHEVKAANYSEPGTSWKYLENPLKKNATRYINYIRKKVKEKL